MTPVEAKIEKKRQFIRRCRSRLAFFGKHCLKVKPKKSGASAKASSLIPFVFNRAQKYVHMRLEEQKKLLGRVRALILKGRQQGISTYVAARYYHKSSLWYGINVYILTHEQPASDSLFDMVDRYQEHSPIRPKVGASNAKELEFKRLDGRYVVATAGQKAGGRSRTSTLFHGSEVAFWKNAADHFSASVQTVPEDDGTEIILESTGNGPSGEFFERWQDAEAGISDYIAIFVPWFWQDEYRRPVPEGFKLSSEAEKGQFSDVEYADTFGLDMEQMAWRSAKIHELRSRSLFDQEYPATAAMAFVGTGESTFIEAMIVLRARKRQLGKPEGPLIMGADPAGPGGDRFSIAGRIDNTITFLEWRNKIGTAAAYHWCKDVIMTMKPARFNVDAGGIGAAVLSLLKEDEDIPKGVVKAVNFGSPSQAKLAKPRSPGPKNRRAEMWQRSKDWLEDEDNPPSIPDLDVLQADATAPRIKPNLTNDLLLESKQEMRKRGRRSPDLWDSVVLTFASLTHISSYVDSRPKKVDYGTPDKEVRQVQLTEYGNSETGWMG